jgi:hypothetical protein
MNYTKGEWKVYKSRHHYSIDSGRPINYNEIAKVYYSEANAHLIAAAPAMYEALKEAVLYFQRLANEGHYPEFMMTENGGHGWDNAAKALLKAECKNA